MAALRSALKFIEGYELIPVAAMVATATVSERLLLPALLAIAFLALLRWASSARLIPRTPLDLGVAGLILMSGVSLAITALPEKSQIQALRLWIGIGLFYSLAAWVTSARRAETLGLGTALFAGFLALVALVSVQWIADKLRIVNFTFLNRLPELVSDRVHPNVMAGNLAILLPFPLAVAFFSHKRFLWALRGFFLLVGLAVGVVIILTQSRGAVLAVAAALFLMVWLYSAWAGGALTLVGLGVLGYAFFSGYDFVRVYYWLVAFGGDTLGIRAEIWSRALFMLHDFPFTGIGIGSFTDVMNMLYPLRPTPVEIGHAHQIFLQVGVDLGLPGLVAWCGCLLAAIACAVDLYLEGRRQKSGWRSMIGAGVLASMTALLVHGMTDAVTWGTRAEVLTWAVWGICGGGWIFDRLERQEHAPEISER